MSASRRTRYLVSASGDADTRGQRINENPLGRVAHSYTMHAAEHMKVLCGVLALDVAGDAVLLLVSDASRVTAWLPCGTRLESRPCDA